MAYHHSPNRGISHGLSANARSLGSVSGADCSADERESRSGGEERLDVDLQDKPTYLLEHLATFTVNKESGTVYPADGMRRLLQLEKTTGIWSQKMQLCLDYQWVLIMDYETGNIIERFPASLIQEPTAFTSTDAMELYNNILVFIVSGGGSSRSEMHIFQSQSVSAVHLVEDLKNLRNGKVVTHQREASHSQAHSSSTSGLHKSMISSLQGRNSEHQHQHQHQQQQLHHQQIQRNSTIMEQYDASVGGGVGGGGGTAETDSDHGGYNDEASSTASDKYERDVTVLNHCFDDIEKFIARLQHAAAATRELERRRRNRKSKKKDPGEGLLTLRTRPPHEKEFIDIFAKFKLSFNLLAKLKAHIHDPNAPELVHFLFTPLALIVEAASDTYYEAQLPTHVVNPLLTREAINLLINCVTSKETELWRSLGDAWVIPRDEWKQDIGTAYHPVFLDGWSPDYLVVDELEQPTTPVALSKRRLETATATVHHQQGNTSSELNGRTGNLVGGGYNERNSERNTIHTDNVGVGVGVGVADFSNRSEISMDSIERSGLGSGGIAGVPFNSAAMQSLTTGMQNLHTRNVSDNGNLRKSGLSNEDQMLEAWLDELQATGAKIVIVTYPRTANNDKELSVVRGEYLEVLDDTRKWWKARNARGQIAHVPHTIVAPYNYSENDAGHSQFYGQQQNKAHVENRSPDSVDWIRKKHQDRSDYIQTNEKKFDEKRAHSKIVCLPGFGYEKHISLEPRIQYTTNEYAQPLRLKTNESLETSKHGRPMLLKSQTGAKIPTPPPFLPPTVSRGELSSNTKDSLQSESQDPIKQTTASSTGDVQDELKNVLRLRTNKAPSVYIDRESSSSDVSHWLRVKDFSPIVVQCLTGYNGEDLLALPTAKLEENFGQEGRRLASQIKLQKSISGYKTARTLELQTVLARTRPRLECHD